ncbi:MAG: hypothetical protein QW406_06320 [Ignisphaera sp.]
MEIEIVDSGGRLSIPISLIYALLRRGYAKLKGRYMVIAQECVSLFTDIKLGLNDIVPEVGFCPSEEPSIIDVDDVLKDVCLEVYRYFEDRCAACVIKVYSVVEEMWLIDEETLVELFNIARDHRLPLEWSTGSIVLTTCPENYGEAYRELKPGDYIKGLEKLRKALTKLSKHHLVLRAGKVVSSSLDT